MDFTLRQSTVPADSVVDELRAEGISYEDIRTALDLQATQRQSGVPVLPLRVICGLEQHKSTSSNVLLNATRAIVGTFEIDFRIMVAEEIRWISARGLGDDAALHEGQMFGVFLDVTGRKQAEEGNELLAGEMSHRVKNLLPA